MKLLEKTQRYYLPLLFGLLIVWSAFFMLIISQVLQESVEESLQSELESTLQLLEKQEGTFLENYALNNPLFDYKKLENSPQQAPIFSDTLIYSALEDETIPYRQLEQYVEVNGVSYQVTMRKSLIEFEDLLTAILLTEAVFLIFFFGGMYVLNQRFFNKIWAPFFHSLSLVSGFRASDSKGVQFPETEIEEFTQLNQVLLKMMETIGQDYQSLKQFTENASHEIQTPLAIISSKIELLLQQDAPKELHWESLQEMYEATGRLSRLNKALLLLTNIENHQFEKNESVLVRDLCEQLLPEYKDLAEQAKVTISTNFESEIPIKANKTLVVTLIRNLISNSIRHNIEGGEISMQLMARQFIISNTGVPTNTNPAQFFERFAKNSTHPHSLGLGLSIVFQICELHGFDCIYQVENTLHTITIDFNTDQR